jgi:hypothetical protein
VSVARYCLGLFRERAHSPGREGDDAEILRLAAKQLEAHGFLVTLMSPEDLDDSETPSGVFLMCERVPVLERLAVLERRGVPHVNTTEAVLNTYRERMIARLAAAGVPFIASRLVATSDPTVTAALPVWVKRADVHNTQDGDVIFADTPARLRGALDGMAARGVRRAALQPHVGGDLVKFYGIGAAPPGGGPPPWFRWFYHRDQVLAGHAFDVAAFGRLVQQAASALGLEIYGGDAIVPPTGIPVLIDVNAWPSFALYRDDAAERIAAHLAMRFAGARA